MIKLTGITVFLLLSAAACFAGEHQAEIDVAGMMQSPGEDGNYLPDFSRVGYMGGGVPLPDVPVVEELSPGGGGDRERIQAALDEIGEMPPDENGFRGALLLRAGEYRVDGPLHIEKSGVVLRGEGQFEGGTVIVSVETNPGPFDGERRRTNNVIFLGDPERPPTSLRLRFLEQGGARTEITGRVPVGSKELPVAGVEGFAPGDNIVVDVRPNEKWLERLGVEEYWGTWINHRYERKVEAVEDGRLIIDVPMVHYIEPEQFRQLSVFKYCEDPRISQSGVEHLRVKTFNSDDYMDESHAVSAVVVNRARDCWVRNVTALHFQFAAVAVYHEARNITVQDCAFLRPVSMIAGSRRYAFYNSGSMSLFQRCYAREARHAFASSARCTGPNVFLDCLAEENYSDIGPHMMWDAGYLYDNIMAPSGAINVQHTSTPGHRWRGANTVFWNCKSAVIRCDRPPTGDTNWSVGSIATRRPGAVHEAPGAWKSHGRRVSPRSLYLWQLAQRLGEEAVEDVTVAVQRQDDESSIEDYLRGEFAEYTERETANRGNLFRGCPRFKNIEGRHFSSWRFESPGKDLDRERIQVYLEKGVINRAENPVWGDNSALELPAGVFWHWSTWGFDYPSPSAEEYGYTLEFDYKMGEKGSISPRIIHTIIEYDENNESNWRNLGSVAGPLAFGEGGWEKYSLSFSLVPEPDGRGVPYPMLVRVRLEADESFLLANPRLELTGEAE